MENGTTADSCDPVPCMDSMEASKWRDEALRALPRLGTRNIEDPARLIRTLEDIALELGDMLAEHGDGVEHRLFRISDLLDDVLDCIDAAKANLLK